MYKLSIPLVFFGFILLLFDYFGLRMRILVIFIVRECAPSRKYAAYNALTLKTY